MRISRLFPAVAALLLLAPWAGAAELVLAGRLLDRHSRTIAGASVILIPLSISDDETSVLSDADGGFRFGALAAGRYALRADADGFLPAERVLHLAVSRDHVEIALDPLDVERVLINRTAHPLTISEDEDPDVALFLRRVAGLSAERHGAVNARPVVRGLREPRLGVFIDGTRSVAASPLGFDSGLSRVNPHTVDRLRVLSGAEALTWGPGALAAIGVDTYVPPIGEDDVRGSVDLEAGSNGEDLDAYGDVFHGHRTWTWILSFAHRRGHDYEAGDGSRVDADFRSSGFHSRWALQLREDLLAEFLWNYQEQFDVDQPANHLDTVDGQTRSHAVQLTWSGQGMLRRAHVKLYAHRKDHLLTDDLSAAAETRVVLPAESDISGGRFRAELGGRDLSATFGLDYQKLEQDTTQLGAEIEQLGSYAQLIYQRQRTRWSATLRFDDEEASTETGLGETGSTGRGDAHMSAAVHGAFELANHWTLTLEAGRAVRTASALERYADVFGHPRLDPEASLEGSLAIRGRRGGFSFSAAIFYRTIDDFITREAVSPDAWRFINGDEATYYGGEVIVHHRVNDLVAWWGSLSSLRARDETFAEPLPGIAPWRGEVGFRFRPLRGRLEIDLASRFAGGQERVSSRRREPPTPGYAVYDLRLRVQLRDGLHLRGGVENLTDKAYAHHLNAWHPVTGQRILEAGRSFRVGLGFRFNMKPQNFGGKP